MGHYFEDAADGISRPQHLVHFFSHLLLSLRVSTIQHHLIPLRKGRESVPRKRPSSIRRRHSHYMAEHVDSQVAQEQLRQSTNGNPRR